MKFKIKNRINYASNHIVFILMIVFSVIFTDNYYLIYSIFSFYLIYLLIFQNNIIIKLFSIFFICYYFIPLPNISTYRGTITIETIKFYTLMMLVALLPLITTLKIKAKQRVYKTFRINKLFKIVMLVHLFIVYLTIMYVLLFIGNVFLNQELRLKLSPAIGYLLKSSIYITFFYFFLEKESRRRKTNILLFIVLPILPSVFIGSRGVAILALIALVLLAIIKAYKKGEEYYLNRNEKWKTYLPLIKYSSIVVFILLQGVYYLRRIGSDSLLSNRDLAIQYFGNDNWYNYLLMPLHFTFREITGLTNTIIKNDVSNPIDTPLFIAELLTVLPGEQPAPGRVLGSLIGTTLDGGLTPGILGALYIDYRWFSLLIIFLFMWIIQLLGKKSLYSDFYKILFSITTVQFLHLFHRGFIKPEYIVAYIVIVGYYIISKFTLKKRFFENLER